MRLSFKRFVRAVVVLLLVACLVSCEPPAKNDGREWGYYGDFNRFSNALVSIPGVTVTNYWMNRDITLEEFGFDITIAAGEAVHFGIGERGRDPLRNMSRPELMETLNREIAQQIAQTNR